MAVRCAPRLRSWRSRMLFAVVALVLAVAAWEARDPRGVTRLQATARLRSKPRGARG